MVNSCSKTLELPQTPVIAQKRDVKVLRYCGSSLYIALYKRKVKGIVGKGYILMYVVIISFGVAKKI